MGRAIVFETVTGGGPLSHLPIFRLALLTLPDVIFSFVLVFKVANEALNSRYPSSVHLPFKTFSLYTVGDLKLKTGFILNKSFRGSVHCCLNIYVLVRSFKGCTRSRSID